MATARAFAPAKINLTLHVTGQRDDGYHLLDSLVIFGDVGDHITVRPASRTRLQISGPMAAGVPADGGNLVVRAADLMQVSADIHLEKHLPAAAGIGGGSADAAATFRALSAMAGQPQPDPKDALALGADVPLCMSRALSRMRGIGDQLDRLGAPPRLSLLLVNPGIAVPTAKVFQALRVRDLAPMDPMPMPDGDDWIDWLATQRNDLQAPATMAAPAIGQVLNALRQSAGCRLARMSGSGATCFAIMTDDRHRDRAASALKRNHPTWWVAPCNEYRASFD